MPVPNSELPDITFQRHCFGVDWIAVKSLYRLANFDNGRSPTVLKSAFEGSQYVCIATMASSGSLIGTARAISDRITCAAIFDVCVHPDLQRSGLGTQMMQLLMSEMSGQFVLLTTPVPDFYTKLGFRRTGEAMWKVCD
jgi:N-acetylglutamate synthase-like GNAT family acetyltransferase